MIDFVLIGLVLVLLGFAYLSINQDFKNRRVSNNLTFSLFGFSFLFFVYSSFFRDVVWMDYFVVFGAFLLSYYVYKKDIWGAADGKLFIAIMLLLVGFSGSDMFLRWILNLLFFYSIVIVLVALIRTSKKEKVRVLKKIDYVDSGIVILVVFVFMDILFKVYMVDKLDVYATLMFFLVLIVLLNRVKKYLKFQFEKMFFDAKLMLGAILSMWLFLYRDGWHFFIYFGIVLSIRILVMFVSELSGDIKRKNGEVYHSPFSLYLFLTAIFTILTNRGFVEIIVFALGI